jgi:AcrR family transcriptional regulator
MAVEFLWGERAERSRGPKPKLSLDQIADAAIAIADAEGLAAVSMQRVAAQLGYTKMSLYRYLPGKTELVALMVERAMGEPPPLAGQDWRAPLAEWCRLLLAGFLRHPWTLEATVGTRPLGPHEVGWMESALTVLAGTPLTGGERLDAMVLLAGHARMLAEQTAARPLEVVAPDRPRPGAPSNPEVVAPDRPRPAAAAGSEEQLSAVIATVIAGHGGRFPQLKSAMAEAAATGGQNQAFHFGLERILDGLEVLIRTRAGANPNRP